VAELVPAISITWASRDLERDARDKRGHDNEWVV
jgi:hypothetical protein